jgi:hypothetical protein
MLKHNLQEISFLIAVVCFLQTTAIGQEDFAPVVRKEVEEELVVAETPLTDADRDHWAFRAVTRAAFPVVRQVEWPRNGVDSFVLSRLELATLKPTAEANRAVLLRRLSFDLTGLPPTPAELADFESDAAVDAYERQVERFLASPGYGERWGQHWLDLARFAETDGFEHDKVRADAWKYRDWVIGAFNENMPYDRFAQLGRWRSGGGDDVLLIRAGHARHQRSVRASTFDAERDDSDRRGGLSGSAGWLCRVP